MLEKITALLKTVRNHRAGLGKEVEELKQRRDVLELAPLNRKDVLEHYTALLDAASRESSKVLESYALSQVARQDPGWDFKMISPTNAPFSILRAGQGGTIQAQINEFHLMAILAPRIKEWLAETVSSWEWPDGSLDLSRQERIIEIKKLDDKIAKLEAQIAKIDGESQSAGVTM